jgi:hypothetical protein
VSAKNEVSAAISLLGNSDWYQSGHMHAESLMNELSRLQSSLAEKDETIAGLREEVDRCHARLEIDHVFTGGGKQEDGGFLRVEVPMGERKSLPDAVACRDDTIELQGEQIAELRARCEAAESDPCPHCEGSGRSACWNCDGTGRRHDNIRDSFNLAPAQSADRWDGKHWLEGTAGGCNIVTYNGEDVVGVGYIANDNAREQVIADHNARLDAQSADTPSEAPLDICGRPAQLLADPDDYV